MERWLLAGPERLDVGKGYGLRLLTAMEVLQARREAEELFRETGEERALCSNACLVAKALERKGEPVYPSGKAVLEGMRLEEIAELAKQWAQFNRSANPSAREGQETLEPLKKAWSTRLMSALSGACSMNSGHCPRKNGRGR